MLCNLKIHNFILIDDLELDFRSGFSVITGETGAGKSIILDAILFAFGQNISRNIAKNNEQKTQITLCFEASPEISSFLAAYDIDTEDNEDVIVKRVYSNSGKNKFYINDQIVSKKIISELADYVIEIHGQHSHTALLDAKKHLTILDEFAQNDQLLSDVLSLNNNCKELEKKIKLIEQKKADIERDIEYLEYTCNELEEVNIQPREAEQLDSLRRDLQFREKEIARTAKIISDIEQHEFSQLIARIQKSISQSSTPDKFCTIESKLETVYDNLEEILDELRTIGSSMTGDEYSFEEVDDRLNLIKELARKHNCLPDDLPEFLEKSQQELAKLKNLIIESNEFSAQLMQLQTAYKNKAIELSNTRQKAAKMLEKLVQEELIELEMKKASFFVKIATDENKITATGLDEVCFLASTNPGMPAGAINQVASGGELSRLMLGLRAVLFATKHKSKPVEFPKKSKMIIFDEIDVGISGSVAESVGVRLKNLSKSTQVLVITHQPQVASKADCHILVDKKQFSNHTQVQVMEIDGDQKSREIARMISGKEITATGIKAAEELIRG